MVRHRARTSHKAYRVRGWPVSTFVYLQALQHSHSTRCLHRAPSSQFCRLVERGKRHSNYETEVYWNDIGHCATRGSVRSARIRNVGLPAWGHRGRVEVYVADLRRYGLSRAHGSRASHKVGPGLKMSTCNHRNGKRWRRKGTSNPSTSRCSSAPWAAGGACRAIGKIRQSSRRETRQIPSSTSRRARSRSPLSPSWGRGGRRAPWKRRLLRRGLPDRTALRLATVVTMTDCVILRLQKSVQLLHEQSSFSEMLMSYLLVLLSHLAESVRRI